MSVLAPTVAAVRQPEDLADVSASYDRVADAYVEMGAGLLGPEPWLRAALAAFAEHAGPLGPVLDVGCGPGTTTAHLAALGVDVRGVDLSPRMVEHARRLHPGVRFEVGSATDLRLADACLGGALGWWSLFNLPRVVLAEVVTDLARALVPGGQLLLGLHVGQQDVHRTSAYGVDGVRWTTHRWLPEALVAVVEGAGLELVTELRFPARGAQPPQVLLCAQRPGVAGQD